MVLLQELWLEKGYERRGTRQMFDTPSNLTTGNEKPQGEGVPVPLEQLRQRWQAIQALSTGHR